MVPVWKIETSGQEWSARAKTWQEAIRKAFRSKPPRNVGVLVRIMEGEYCKKESFNTYQRRWSYVDGLECVRLAGFPVRHG